MFVLVETLSPRLCLAEDIAVKLDQCKNKEIQGFVASTCPDRFVHRLEVCRNGSLASVAKACSMYNQ